ncbi:hypothetical protein FQZ97_838660 [compost metagenome]
MTPGMRLMASDRLTCGPAASMVSRPTAWMAAGASKLCCSARLAVTTTSDSVVSALAARGAAAQARAMAAARRVHRGVLRGFMHVSPVVGWCCPPSAFAWPGTF